MAVYNTGTTHFCPEARPQRAHSCNMPEPKFPHVFPDGFRLPAPAQKTDLTADAGISLGLSAAEIVRRARAEKRLAVIVCADAGDMIKLADELTWFDPTLRV